MSYHGKQNVSYHQVGIGFMETYSDLSKPAQRLLHLLHEECCIKDNCLQMTFAALLKTKPERSSKKAYDHRKELMGADLLKVVTDIHGRKRDMVNPEFLWSHNRNCLRFACNLYRLGSHAEAAKISKLELRHSSRIDPLTGELNGSYIERADDVTYGRALELSAENYYDYKAHFGRSGVVESWLYKMAQAELIG